MMTCLLSWTLRGIACFQSNTFEKDFSRVFFDFFRYECVFIVPNKDLLLVLYIFKYSSFSLLKDFIISVLTFF
jgi:hypothetical protein